MVPEWYDEHKAAIPILVRGLQVPWLLRIQEKLPSSSPLKRLHVNTLRRNAKQILDILSSVSLDDYKSLFFLFDHERELKHKLFCDMQAAFTSYGPHHYPKVAANEAIASMFVCLGVEHQAKNQVISDIAEQLRKRKSRRQS